MKLKMKETLARVLSYLFKCEKKTLLWTNPHPYGSFSAQTVQLNLSGYDAVEVLFRHWTDSAYCAFAKCEKGNNCGMATVPSNVNAGIMRRGFSITNSGVAFDDGQGVLYDGTYQTGLSNAAVPQKIYGIVGGVLRNPVIARLTAIFTSLLFGGDVDEGQYKEAVGEGADESTRTVIGSHTPKRGQLEQPYRSLGNRPVLYTNRREQFAGRMGNTTGNRGHRDFSDNIRCESYIRSYVYRKPVDLDCVEEVCSDKLAASERGWVA